MQTHHYDLMQDVNQIISETWKPCIVAMYMYFVFKKF